MNELLPTHPLFNVPPRAVARSLAHFDLLNDNFKDLRTPSSCQHDSDGNQYKNDCEKSSIESYMDVEGGVNTTEEEEAQISSVSSSISN